MYKLTSSLALLTIFFMPPSVSHATDTEAHKQRQIAAFHVAVGWGYALHQYLLHCDASRASALQAEWTKQQDSWKSRAAELGIPPQDMEKVRQASIEMAEKEWRNIPSEQRAEVCKELLDNLKPPAPSTPAQK